MQALEVQNQRIRRAHLGIWSCARGVLNGQLAILGSGQLDALDVLMRLPGAAALEDLMTLLLEQVSGHRAAPLPLDCAIVSRSQVPATVEAVRQLSPLLINYLLDRARQRFPAAYSKQLRVFFTSASRPRALSSSRMSWPVK
jgi:hypothetical protein